MSTQAEKKKKGGFKVPPLLFLMLGILMIMCLLTYVVPAGQFVADPETGALTQEFAFLGEQSPISPWKALNLLLQGTQNSSFIISLLLFSGGTVGIIMDTGAIDEMINWAVYKLQDKGLTVLLPILFCLIGILGAFGGGDQMVAIVPIGVMFAKKLRLDPIIAVAVTYYASFIGFATGPTRMMIPQLMIDVPVYSGFGVRFVTMLVSVFIAMIFTVMYAKKVQKDPTKSAMGNTDWLNDLNDDTGELKAYEFNGKAALVTLLFFAQYFVTVIFMTQLGYGSEVMIAIQLITGLFCGFFYGMSAAKINGSFAKGAGGMAFIGVVIGLAGTMSLIMNQGKIIHTLVHYITLPLANLSKGLSTVGISIVVMLVNLVIPSASAKAAILMPIIKPLTESLGVTPQVAVSAYQFGDGFTKVITPALGATVGSLEIAKVPYDKWLKWCIPSIAILSVMEWVLLYFLAMSNWTGGM